MSVFPNDKNWLEGTTWYYLCIFTTMFVISLVVCVCERVCACMYMCMHRLNLMKIKAVGYFIKYKVFACMLFSFSNLQIKLRKSYK